MYAAPTAEQGLIYRPYLSDGEKYKKHFSLRQSYDCAPFQVIGPVASLSPNVQAGEGDPTIKLVSPTEGAVERAEEDKKREDKATRKQKRLQSVVGGGRGKTSNPSKKSSTRSKIVATTVKTKGKSTATPSPKTSTSKAKAKPIPKTVLKRK